MIDNFSLALAHLLLGIAIWRIIGLDALDREPPAGDPSVDA